MKRELLRSANNNCSQQTGLCGITGTFSVSCTDFSAAHLNLHDFVAKLLLRKYRVFIDVLLDASFEDHWADKITEEALVDVFYKRIDVADEKDRAPDSRERLAFSAHEKQLAAFVLCKKVLQLRLSV